MMEREGYNNMQGGGNRLASWFFAYLYFSFHGSLGVIHLVLFPLIGTSVTKGGAFGVEVRHLFDFLVSWRSFFFSFFFFFFGTDSYPGSVLLLGHGPYADLNRASFARPKANQEIVRNMVSS